MELCTYYEALDMLEPHNLIPPGVWTLEGMLSYRDQQKQCPYYTARRMMPFCNVIIYSYHYLLDPKKMMRVSKELSKDIIGSGVQIAWPLSKKPVAATMLGKVI